MTSPREPLGKLVTRVAGTITGAVHSETERRIDLTARELRARAVELDFVISADGRVGERDAAQLIPVHHETMRRWRAEGGGPIAYQRPVGRARVSYALDDLAHWLVFGREKNQPDPC